eukprot:CAMPEP_0201122808 /NCGR_PEP_ID=MMETSP0850-20130426/6350_1 /ASSEMBLY_ACC=CAM_ASM_000622 /TAXON_ID=183588 /ORGANISM="Pseudo-nitzschia fraudulenta, Strain WWA7" /LENGTH=347 /DNA_ID=CAMNT_0047389577 /DNA_START=69 /DNA_END=1109 /DNA_ORIENTATION=-
MTETTGPILVCGGAGYIGSHTILCLLQQGYNVVVVDNLVNSSMVSLDRVAELANLDDTSRKERLVFHNVDLCDRNALKRVFETSPTFSACIHFAGLKAVGESTKIPLKYYHNNLTGTFYLLELMDEFGCHSIVFSSSATVYGAADQMPITEQTNIGNGITNAYGRTKYMIEEILRDFYKSKTLGDSKTDWSIVILRYFNPIGAHPSGKIGEDPNGIPNNLMPYVAQVAAGRREFLTVFGNDYPTPDGTGVRDYLHVMDLANGHICAIEYMQKKEAGTFTFNLGTGNGCSVIDMVKAMGKACGVDIKYKVGARRPGDIATCYADASLAKKEMGWEAKHTLDEMCRDLW